MKKRTKKEELQRRKNFAIALKRAMNTISKIDLDKVVKDVEGRK